MNEHLILYKIRLLNWFDKPSPRPRIASKVSIIGASTTSIDVKETNDDCYDALSALSENRNQVSHQSEMALNLKAVVRRTMYAPSGAEAECGAKVVVCGRVFGATKQTPILHRYMMLALTSARNHWVSGAEPMFRFSTCRARTVDLLF
ncbi:hypothetical protein T4D_12988 [Trichinella pseudospiralis]|uniref:Uncharacterized protein n=1 Tax=Trichinella pseudospiralis TaxID=6337 RepID=A0A0V1FE23_TRIPS|nr:hypothetical protein T4D_12988 [Trichinella pseudospiralis]